MLLNCGTSSHETLRFFSGADIFNLDYFDALDRSGMLAGVLTGLMAADHRPAVRSFVIIAPPETDLEVAHPRAWSALLETFQLLGRPAVSGEGLNWLENRFKLIKAPDLATQSLIAVIADQPAEAAIIVADAAKYRRTETDHYVAPGAEAPMLPEDIWVPQVHALATSAVEVARERTLEAYVRRAPKNRGLDLDLET